MRFWVYKCNSLEPEYAKATGDWAYVFERKGPTQWGATTLSGVDKLEVGDVLLAYQTNRNELVGTARVDDIRKVDGVERIFVSPVERIGIKVLPLKKADAKIGSIPALQGGPIRTAYDISNADARRLLKAAGAVEVPNAKSSTGGSSKSGAGFGAPEHNRKVEKAAIAEVWAHYEAKGYRVVDRQSQNVGYDLECSKGTRSLHVEVKGISGGAVEFGLTKNELATWKMDPDYILVAVTNALSVAPTLHFYRGDNGRKQLSITPFSYRAKLA